MQNYNTILETLRWITHGPRFEVIKHSSYEINEHRYSTKENDVSRVYQNSGVMLLAKIMQIVSSKDKSPAVTNMTFYGIIQEIWDFDYNKFRIRIFKCYWVDSNQGIKIDELGLTIVDLNRIEYKYDSFILASKAKQVFYVEYQLDPRWSIVHVFLSNDYDMSDDEKEETIIGHEPLTTSLLVHEMFCDVMDDNGSTYVRLDCEGTWIDNRS